MPDLIASVTVQDIRFPTSLEKDGSDAMNKAPDYSSPYVTVTTQAGLIGHGITFTVGRGNNIVASSFGPDIEVIFSDFAGFCEVTHHVKTRSDPLWKLLVDMEPEKLVSTIDFRYLEDALTKEEAIAILKSMQEGKAEREKEMKENGYPAYTTSCAWLGYSDEKIIRLCEEAMAEGFTRFKMKVGSDLQDDKRRAQILRQTMKPEHLLMVDANQKWEVQEAIDWMRELVHFNITWIEEPTSPDDVLGHAEISKALKPLGIGVATGEQCQNRVMFKQFLKSGAMQFCQIDSCRLGGVNENLAVILMAKKYGVPVCPHGGGVGLCEYIQHLSLFDYIAVSGSLENSCSDVVLHLYSHYKQIIFFSSFNGYSQVPGYSIDMKSTSLEEFEWPTGKERQDLFQKGIYKPDNEAIGPLWYLYN
ncbi:unnamed protein product [Candidula unifasciata]|uniref:Mitochondrial enolase superfamily member 1 n=1 Tax=Candidula unifasciata TaxID=100452 RepID=A0A8S3ZI87_9EUPU|nr:unnamed protein product [Candidula unifasciata]